MNGRRSSQWLAAVLVLSIAAIGCGGESKKGSTGGTNTTGTTGTDGTGGTGGTGGDGGTTAQLVAVTLTPAAVSVATGTKQQYTAIAVYADASKQDVTATATWSVDPAAVGTIDASGAFVAGTPGPGTISAAFGGIVASTSVTVSDAVLQSISLTPSDDAGPLDLPVQFTAMGIFSDGSEQDLSSSVTWTPSDASLATISAGGLLQPLTAGVVTVTAASGTVTASTTYTMTSDALSDMDVLPPASVIAVGTSTSLQAIGYYGSDPNNPTYSDDVTAYATWTSDSAAVQVVKGVVTGVAPGSANITATFDGISQTATVLVTASTLQSIAVTPSTVDAMPIGFTQQLTVTGTFSDGSTQDLTSMAAYLSSDASIASVSNAATSIGLVTATGPGSATITAMVGSVTGTCSVGVLNAKVQSITITGSATLPAGYRTQYTATGTFSDGIARDVTRYATWTSSNTAAASISTASPTQGLATGIAAGTTTLSAKLAGVTRTFALTVTNAHLNSITITSPDSTFTVAVGGTKQFSAIGTFSDSSQLDISGQCVWRTKPKPIAWVSRAKPGVVTGTKAGTATLYVHKGPVKASKTLTVQ